MKFYRSKRLKYFHNGKNDYLVMEKDGQWFSVYDDGCIVKQNDYSHFVEKGLWVLAEDELTEPLKKFIHDR